MAWNICGVLSVGAMIAGCAGAYYLHKTKKKILFFNSFNVFAGSIFLSIFFLAFPAYWTEMGGDAGAFFSALFLSIHNAVRLFAVDGDYSVITANLSKDAGPIYYFYTIYASLLFLTAPVLTFGFVLSFFKNVTAYIKYYWSKNKEIYIFSEANKRSVTLAEDLIHNNPKRTIVFTDYFEKNEEESYELSGRIRDLGAICFKKDINVIEFTKYMKGKELHFFAIGSNETENIEQSLKLIEKYRDEEKRAEEPQDKNTVNLYTFSSRVESELLITAIDKGCMKVRRINEVRSLVNRMLQEHGTELFEEAYEKDNDTKKISAVIVGLGAHGSEMLKALSWYCQMDGYELEINAFDKDPLAYDRMYTKCPELLSEEYNGVVKKGEAQYKIAIHEGVDVDSIAFMEKIQAIDHPTYAIVSLGSDAENIRIAAYLRMLFARKGYGEKPVIHAVIYNSDEAVVLDKITNFRGKPYGIKCIGDLKSLYSEGVIKNSKLEEQALNVHMHYARVGAKDIKDPKEYAKALEKAEDEFWRYEYNYCSSLATEIHKDTYQYYKRPKDAAEKTDEEIEMAIEHRRWNAYMRSEGYVYSGSKDKESRNDLAKMHHNLVQYKELTKEDQDKDAAVLAGKNVIKGE